MKDMAGRGPPQFHKSIASAVIVVRRDNDVATTTLLPTCFQGISLDRERVESALLPLEEYYSPHRQAPCSQPSKHCANSLPLLRQNSGLIALLLHHALRSCPRLRMHSQMANQVWASVHCSVWRLYHHSSKWNELSSLALPIFHKYILQWWPLNRPLSHMVCPTLRTWTLLKMCQRF
jgi:hypothetical protein